MALSAGLELLVVSSKLTSTMKALLKKSDFPHFKNLINTLWAPINWNRELVARRPVYPVWT